MRGQKSTVELLAIIHRMKQGGASLEAIIETMERKGLHRDNTTELYEALK